MGRCPVRNLPGTAAQRRPPALLFLLNRMPCLHVRHERSPLQLFQAVPRKKQEPLDQGLQLSLLQRRGPGDDEGVWRDEISER